MKRADLDGLDREALIRLAEAHGVSRARILTRPELIDEILLRRAASEGEGDVSIARGFFGLARDLVASVVERGLHLPDAATKIRGIHLDVPKRFTPPAVLPTVTLAQIYASQGHTARAIDTLRKVLEAEPDHTDARDLLGRLQDKTYVPPKEPLPPEEDPARDAEVREEDATAPRSGPSVAPATKPSEAPPAPLAAAPGEPERQEAPEEPEGSEEPEEPEESEEPEEPESPDEVAAAPVGEPPPAMLDDRPLPPRYDVDECVALPVDPSTLFVYWEVREELVAKVASLRGAGVLALRALVVEPGWHGPRTYVRDHDVHASLGDYFLRELPAGAVVRVAVGFRTPTAFLPLAHSPHLSLPRNSPVSSLAHVLVRWTPMGVSPVSDDDPVAGFYARALRRVGERGLLATEADHELAEALGLPELGRLTVEGHGGSSESRA